MLGFFNGNYFLIQSLLFVFCWLNMLNFPHSLNLEVSQRSILIKQTNTKLCVNFFRLSLLWYFA